MSIFSKKRIYADWAATTPIHKEVLKAMKKAEKVWANPSGIYKESVLAKKTLENERLSCARLIGVKPEEIYFTSGGTESNNTIIHGIVGAHIVSSSIEHSSILESLKIFEQNGGKVTYVSPSSDGIIRVEDILSAVTPQTVLVTCMYANNEIGTIQPISKIGAGIRKIRAENNSIYPIFHTDASQAPLWLSCEMEGLRVDSMTLDAHKMQGPKGVGVLAIRRYVPITPLIIGGGQERGMRSTTESLSLISGFTKALSIAQNEWHKKTEKAKKIQTYFFKQISEMFPNFLINGSLEKRLPNNINISIPNISDPEFAVLVLDKEGIACSTKSSCLKGEENSYVVSTLGGEEWRAKNTIRFTLDPDALISDADTIFKVLKKLTK